MDITKGHWVFAGIFVILFIGLIIWTFRKEKRITKQQFGNIGIAALVVGGGILMLVLLKIILRQMSA